MIATYLSWPFTIKMEVLVSESKTSMHSNNCQQEATLCIGVSIEIYMFMQLNGIGLTLHVGEHNLLVFNDLKAQCV